ncbi:MAG: DUF4861 domain-containing protein, partial [Prevotellaceae bacterium]|nr:DUF4861 domain-containing protein [Prevotellaceae bacterium]
MKNILLISAALFSLSLSAAEMTVEVKNPLKLDRTQEPVAIGMDKIQAKLKVKITQLSVYDGKTLLCSQLDDFDSDGKLDELSFLLDVKSGETKKIRLVANENVKSPCAEGRVHAQLFLRN